MCSKKIHLYMYLCIYVLNISIHMYIYTHTHTHILVTQPVSGGDGAQTLVLWHQGLLLNSQNLQIPGESIFLVKINKQLHPKADPLSTLSVKGKWIPSTESTYT